MQTLGTVATVKLPRKIVSAEAVSGPGGVGSPIGLLLVLTKAS